jgi:hypothetical protein
MDIQADRDRPLHKGLTCPILTYDDQRDGFLNARAAAQP